MWLAELDPDSEDNTDQTNAWIYETYRERPWLKVYRDWSEGFLRFLELGEAIPEKDLLDAGRYPWMQGQALSLILRVLITVISLKFLAHSQISVLENAVKIGVS